MTPQAGCSPAERAELDRLIQLVPGYDPVKTASAEHWFCYEDAEDALAFFPALLCHVKGMRGPLELQDWQKAVVANLWGWKRADGTRRYREAFVFVPRKNGKTTLCAGLVLLLLLFDSEFGPEVYSAAKDQKQSAILYGIVKAMVLASPRLRAIAKPYKTMHRIVDEERNGFYEAISAEADSKHGFNSHGVVVDELHAQPDGELVDVLETSMGSREQPLMVHITTSDYERPGSICNEKHDYASNVRDGVIEDPEFLPVIYEAGRDDDWRDPQVWYKANPNLGVSFKEDYLARHCRKAVAQKRYENTFKRLYLNIRTEQEVRFIPMHDWNECGSLLEEGETLEGRPCWGGLDVSSHEDLTAFQLVFPVREGYVVKTHLWCPEDRIRVRSSGELVRKAPYAKWAHEGHIRVTPGEVIDLDQIREDILEIAAPYQLESIAFDPWNALQIATQLSRDHGLEMVKFVQGTASMNEPTKLLLRLVEGHVLDHGGHPVLRWMASNTAGKEDQNGNVKPEKGSSADKIDGIVATVMALGRAMLRGEGSVYDLRGGFLEL